MVMGRHYAQARPLRQTGIVEMTLAISATSLDLPSHLSLSFSWLGLVACRYRWLC